MRFNCEKFNEGRNNSNRYDNWSKELLSTLCLAGDQHPYHDNMYKYNVFSISTRRTPTKMGRRRGDLVTHIFCYDDGRIEIEPDDKIKPNEITSVCKQVIHFFAVMQSAGYIVD